MVNFGSSEERNLNSAETFKACVWMCIQFYLVVYEEFWPPLPNATAEKLTKPLLLLLLPEKKTWKEDIFLFLCCFECLIFPVKSIREVQKCPVIQQILDVIWATVHRIFDSSSEVIKKANLQWYYVTLAAMMGAAADSELTKQKRQNWEENCEMIKCWPPCENLTPKA